MGAHKTLLEKACELCSEIRNTEISESLSCILYINITLILVVFIVVYGNGELIKNIMLIWIDVKTKIANLMHNYFVVTTKIVRKSPYDIIVIILNY